MTKGQYVSIICTQTDYIKQLKEQNEALKKSLRRERRNRLRAVGKLCILANEMKDECMIPESEVVQMCIEAVKDV